ncbi:hypothetical protein [Paenibacillus sp. FSL H7-0918]
MALALALASGLAAPTIPTAQPKEPHQKTKSSDPQYRRIAALLFFRDE